MRTLIWTTLFASTLVAITGCSVPDKQPATTDGGTDAMVDPTGAPDTTITVSPAEFSNAGSATFEFESNHDDAHFMCSLDGEPAASCTSPFVRSLADGAHSFSVRAVKPDGEADDSPAEHLWSIDTVAPITTLTEAPPAADNSTMVRFSFMANEMNVVFECSLDSAAFTECRSGDDFGPIGDGAHAFAVRAKDRAGNLDASPAVHAWSVDTSTPDTTLLTGPSGSSASASATFSFLSPDAGPGSTFECSLDGSAFQACTSPVTYTGLTMGVHTFSVRVRDANGNYDPTPATRTWTADLTPPETMLSGAPTGTVAMASASIVFTANEALVTYVCSLDGAAPAACTSPFNVTGLAQGAHTFSVTATDEAGNTDGSPATASWTVDTVTPDIALTGPDDGATTGPRIAYAFTASEGTVECSIAGGAWTACASPRAFNLPAGAGSFSIRATDGAGNQTVITRSWTVACAAPDTAGAAGVLHLDDSSTQVLANATGGATATLGPTDQPEVPDPALATGRFSGGASLVAAESDMIAWPLALGASPAFTVELWALPNAMSGTRDLIVSADNRLAIRVSQDTSTTVRFSVTATDALGVMHTVTSATYASGTWHQVDVSLQDPTLRLWVDGDRTEITDARTSGPTLDSLRIGGNHDGGIDEVWLAQTALTTDDEVLVRYCPFATPRL